MFQPTQPLNLLLHQGSENTAKMTELWMHSVRHKLCGQNVQFVWNVFSTTGCGNGAYDLNMEFCQE